MPNKQTRKINIYKWHRMKKKLISSVVSVLCCLIVMAVGVYASTSHSFEIAVANDMDVKIVAVDGTLYARRKGGVWATAPENESAYGNAITPATDFRDDNDIRGFRRIYDIQNNILTDEMESLCKKIDINVYYNEIEYVFKYVIDRGNIDSNYLGDGRIFKTTTKISIINGVDGTIKPGIDERYDCSYKYYFGNDEPTDWSTVTSEFNVDGKNYILAGDENGKRVVYVRAYFKFDTEDYGRESSTISAEAEKGLGFKGKWQFTLALEELEGTTLENANGQPDDMPDDDNKEFVYELSADGKYVYMGEYPQTIKADNVSIVSSTPDSDGYYKGSDGERYYKYTANVDWGDLGLDEETAKLLNLTTLSNGYQYSNGDTLYFKVEKIKWRILDKNGDDYTLMCDSILQGMAYQSNYLYDTSDYEYYATDSSGNVLYDGSGNKVYANNYKYSELRSFLNGSFYNGAFTTKQKALIKLTNIDNSASSTNDSSNQYACENTNDYVYAMSYADMINTDYGFSENAGDMDPSRSAYTTDFAKATGALTVTEELMIMDGIEPGSEEWTFIEPYIGTGAQWLRSPDCPNSIYASVVDFGASDTVDTVDDPYYGALPALQIRLP